MNTNKVGFNSPSLGVSYKDGVATITTRTKQSMVNVLVTARLTLEDDLPARLTDMKALAVGYLGKIAERDSLQAQLDAAPAAARDVLAERRRQVEAEGYDPEHDDAHPNEEIAAYAALYAMPPAARDWPVTETGYGDTFGAALCPVDWHPKFGDRRRELVKAAALLLAEIERIDRAAQLATSTGGVGKCTVSPSGWYCTRGAAHEGPCAAHEGDA
jgi:hypothetical protein